MPKNILISRVRSALERRPFTAKRMFGGLTFLLNGNMLCCVSDRGLMARIGADAEPSALRRPNATPCMGTGRPMAGFILVRHEGVAADADLNEWLNMAIAYVEQLPSKEPKPPRRVRTIPPARATSK